MMRYLLNLSFVLIACAAMAPTLYAAGDTTPSFPFPSRPADPDYESGKKAIEAGNWTLAIEHFNRAAARDANSADVQNYLGYAYRKSGNLELAFKYYETALRLDPRHKGAHEYIGEAYLMAGNLQKAEQHLAQLDKLCFFSCEEYRDLKKAVEDYKRAKQQALK